MILNKILQTSCVKVPLQGRDKNSVINELIDVLDSHKLLLNKDVALEAVITREHVRSTVVSSGVAIPHGKCKAVKESVIAIGIASQPLDFDSVDGNLVSIVILLISPSDQTKQHIQALAIISKMMFNETFRKKLTNMNTAGEAYKLLRMPLRNEVFVN